MKKIIFIIAVIAVLAVAGRFFLNKQIAKFMQPKHGPVPVLIYNAEAQVFKSEIKAPGTLKSNESATIASEVAGKITSILFNEGEVIKAGALLIEIDDRIYNSELNGAKAAYNLAKITFDRRQELQRKGAYSIQDKDDARAKFEQARANLAIAEERLKKTRIYAPFGGIAGLRNVSQGDFVNIGQEITAIEDVDTMKVDFSMPEKYFSRITNGQEISIEVDAVLNKKFTGKIYAIDPRIDPSSRNVMLRAEVENKEQLLRPGMFATVYISTIAKEGAILLPEQSLVPSGNEMMVYKVVDNKVKVQPVQIGAWEDGKVEIISGVLAGEKIVTDGQMKLGGGVEVIDALELDKQKIEKK